MNTAECYRLLGLNPEAGLDEIKTAYRRLARQYHPDANSGDRPKSIASQHQAQEKFVEITRAYKFLLDVVQPPSASPASLAAPTQPSQKAQRPRQRSPESAQSGSPQPRTKVTRKQAASQNQASPSDDLKQNSYRQLQDLLKFKRFARATALVEGLAQRFPQDPEIRQWQAVTYQQWGRHLIGEKQLEKARIYLKKALRTDPHNRSLWTEVERDFRRLEQVF